MAHNDPVIDELIGLCRGLLANGELDFAEAEYLLQWFQGRPGVLGNPIIERVYREIVGALAGDNPASAWPGSARQAALFEALQKFTGFGAVAGEVEHATTLPLDEPPPDITFAGKHFCFTGKFNFGNRQACSAEVIKRGATAAKDVTQKTDVLVIGPYVANGWVHSSHGRKIERALEIKNTGQPLAIISEEHWQGFLED